MRLGDMVRKLEAFDPDAEFEAVFQDVQDGPPEDGDILVFLTDPRLNLNTVVVEVGLPDE